MEVVRALEEVWSSIDRLLSSLDESEWELPTPNTGWDVKDLAAHLGGLESMFLGFPQPDPPDGWTTNHEGIHYFTALGVAARRAWTTEQVMDELRNASTAQLERMRDLDEDGWQQQTMGPVGMTTNINFADIRLGDVYIHLLDLRATFGLPLEDPAESTAQALVAGRAVQLSGWGAVKRAGLGDGTRIRLELSGEGGITGDLVVSDGRGGFESPGPAVVDRVEGAALAYLLEVGGRHEMAEAAGGLFVEGAAAQTLLDGYRLFE